MCVRVSFPQEVREPIDLVWLVPCSIYQKLPIHKPLSFVRRIYKLLIYVLSLKRHLKVQFVGLYSSKEKDHLQVHARSFGTSLPLKWASRSSCSTLSISIMIYWAGSNSLKSDPDTCFSAYPCLPLRRSSCWYWTPFLKKSVNPLIIVPLINLSLLNKWRVLNLQKHLRKLKSLSRRRGN